MKKLFVFLGFAVFAAVVAFNINAGLRNDAIMDMALDRAEAIARNEGATIDCDRTNCYGVKCHKYVGGYCPCEATGSMSNDCWYGK